MTDCKKHRIIKTENLAIGYASKQVNKAVASSININLNAGELIGLIGGNGIGKSTLLRTLTQVQPPLDGKIFIKEKPISHYTSINLAKVMSLVLTDKTASKNLSVLELVTLGRYPYTNWVGRLTQKDKDAVNQALKLTDIEDLKLKKCFELSDGQLQRVMLARALAQDTDIIILDEPTTHLDMYHKAHILKLLKTLAKNTNKTILFSSHEIDLAIQLCNKLVVMTDKEVVCDTPSSLINTGVFETLFPKNLIYFDKTSKSFKVNK